VELHPGGDSIRTAAEIAKEKELARRYLDTDGHEMQWTLIRTALASVADTVLIPLQDVIGLGSEARMNLPGRQAGNWDSASRGTSSPLISSSGSARWWISTTARSTRHGAAVRTHEVSTIWNMSFGFLGIQFGWGLQMANMSAIYEYLGPSPTRSRCSGSPRR